MRPSYFGHHEFAKHAPGLETLGDAEAIRAKILSAYEAAEQTDDPDETRQANDLRAGRRRPDRCRAGRVDCRDGCRHPALEFPADRSCEDLDSADRGR